MTSTRNGIVRLLAGVAVATLLAAGCTHPRHRAGPPLRRRRRVRRGEHRATGLLGDTLLVNGTVGPYLQVATERVRLRLLNASTARIYDFGLADHRRFALIGSDGGLLPATYQTDHVQLSPGERAEVVVTMRPGERVVLQSSPPELGTSRGMTELAGGRDAFDVLQLRTAPSLAQSAPPPQRLVPVPRLDPATAVATREFRLVWQVTNQHTQPHSFHVHGVQFQVLDAGGAAPPPPLAGWKDTVYLPPSVPLRLVVRFGGDADPDHPYMFHCHLLFHEDSGMMGQSLVAGSGHQPDAPGGGYQHAHHH
jgi:blue copper oxidase